MNRLLTTPILLLALGLSTLAASAQIMPGTKDQEPPPEFKDDWGRQKLIIPGLTERGNWEGSWFYISREFHIALWLKESGEGLPEIQMRLFRLGGGEQFVTNWSGLAQYTVRNAPARFNLALTGGDENTLDADWNWTLDFASSSRHEVAKVKIYRTGDGRRLALHFDDFVRTLRRGRVVNELPLEQVWVFRKASKRIVDWSELPF